jgi:hypothetical protein
MATILLSCIVNPLVVIAISTMIPMVLYITLWRGFSQKKRLASAICVFIVCALTNIGICLLIANNPIVICSSEYSEYIDEERKEQIQEDVKSLYKEKGLLFPAIIEVKYADKECLKLHIQYLFFGTVDFSVDADQTKSIDKPLY